MNGGAPIGKADWRSRAQSRETRFRRGRLENIQWYGKTHTQRVFGATMLEEEGRGYHWYNESISCSCTFTVHVAAAVSAGS